MRSRLSRAEQSDRNREALLAAARRVFLARGYAGATLDAIAEEAGFSKGAVYSRFESKADLFLALLDQRIADRAEQNERLTAGLAGAKGVAALLETAERDARSGSEWQCLLVEFRVHAAHDPELNRRYAQAHAGAIARLAETLARLHDRAGVVPAFPPRRMAEFIFALGSGLVLERAADPGALPLPTFARMIVRALGLAATQEDEE